MKQNDLLTKLLLLCLMVVGSTTGAWADTVWEMANWSTGHTGLTYWASGASSDIPSTSTDKSTPAWPDASTYNKYCGTGGSSNFQLDSKTSTWKSSNPNRVWSFDVAANDVVKVYFMGGGSGNRSMYVSYNATTTNRDTNTAFGSATADGYTPTILSATATSAGTVYLWCDANVRVYAIKVESGSPTLTVDPSSQESGFSGVTGGAASVEQTYTVTGTNIGDKTITATLSNTTDFEMRTGENAYGAGPLKGLASGTAVDVRLKAGLSANHYDSNLTFSCTGAADVVIALEGTVSAASAPSISVSGEASVARGGELTLTATAEGVPTPTVEWFQCDDALKTNSVSQGEASTSNTSFAVPTTTVGTYYFYAKAVNSAGNNESDVKTINVVPKAPVLTAGGNFYTDNMSVEIAKADGEDESATIKYKVGDGLWTDYTEPLTVDATSTISAKVVQDEFESTEASATYTKVVLDKQTDVEGETIWDWSEVTNSSAVDFSDKNLNNKDVLYSNISKYGFTAVSGLSSQSALLMNGQRAYNNANGSKHCQVNYLKFNTTVDGVVVVEYANTGGNAARTVNVNGTKGSKSVENNTSYVAEAFTVDAGAVTIKGVQVSDDADKMLRIRKVVFAPAKVFNLNASGFATYSAGYDFTVSGATAYKMTLDLGEGTLVGASVTKVPAGAGVLLKGEANAKVTITATTGAETLTSNSLKGTTKANGSLVEKSGSNTFYALSGAAFKPFTGASFAANKAYFEVEAGEARNFTMTFEDGETTSIAGIETKQNMENMKFYNLNGQQVEAPTKGLYIVNGRKVVIK